MLLAFDVGNSGIKVGVFDGESLVATARLTDPRSDLAAVLGRSVAGAVLVAVSVNEDALAALLKGSGKGARVLGRDLPIRMLNRYHDPAETGPDRLAAAAAAHATTGGAAVVADLGSAVTVDVVDDDGVFLGGTIGPGRSALVAGLRGAAPALPCAGELPEGLPRSTGEAIRAGIEYGLAGIVERLVSEARKALPRGEGAPVFLTGGDAREVAGRLPFPVRLDPDLVLHGVRILYDRAGEDPCT